MRATLYRFENLYVLLRCQMQIKYKFRSAPFKESAMRWSLAALVAIALLASFNPSLAGSPSGDGAFCINGLIYGGGLGDCSYASYAQCQATASGTEATCLANPYYTAKVETQPGPRPGRVSRRR
jgi:hypothetical protein